MDELFVYTIEEVNTDNCTYCSNTVHYVFLDQNLRDSVFRSLELPETNFCYMVKGKVKLISDSGPNPDELAKKIKKELKDIRFY